MSNSGAKAALRGYRLQTLYVLSRLMNSENREHLFQPEGNEDLDIYSSTGQLLETVQIKANTPNLTLSDFSPEKESSFLKRSLGNWKANPDSTIRVVSFGPVGPEIENAWTQEGPERERVRRKLTDYGYTSVEIDELLTIKFSEVSEAKLEKDVYAFLESTLTGGDPCNALNLLMYWVFLASELQEKIVPSTVMDRLIKVGCYLEGQSAYHNEWFTSILPLADTLDSAGVDPQRLSHEFQQGIDARYEHILANLDAVRSEKLSEIQQKFESCNVVVIHGASGQGKSTLAFRFLHDCVLSDWRFFVDLRQIEDKRQILRVANALSGHAKAINRPCMVYIDVSPSDQDWPELVRALSDLPGLRILITIREEDWRRATGYRARFNSEELELTFDREEANRLYAELREPPAQFLAFDEAWSDFGHRGPLLEFVYFLTQNETLKSRIESQIRNLQDRVRERKLEVNELSLLRLVAVASAYEAKLDLSKVVQHLGLIEPTRTIELFTKEYLIRVDERSSTITGLHSVRSNIMLESLLDEVLCSWESVAIECLPLVVETDLEVFLLHAFSRRRTETTTLLEELKRFCPESWTGVAGILRAMLWLGVRDYTEANRDLIDQEVGGRAPAAWFLKLDGDLAGIARDEIPSFVYNLSDAGERNGLLEQFESVREKQTPKEDAFVFARDWLQCFDSTNTSSSVPQDFAGLALVLFWAGHLEVRDLILTMCAEIDLDGLIEELPIDTLADLIYALSIALGNGFDSVFQECRTRVELRFKRETNTFFLEDDGGTVRSHFIPSLAFVTDQEVSNSEDTGASIIHEDTMYRVDLMRKLFPDRQKYGSQGYGHRLGVLSPEFDETEKAIDANRFYPHWAQAINFHFRTLGDYPYRPENWEEHAQQILGLRQEVTALLVQLQKALNTFFRKATLVKLYGDLLSPSKWESCSQLTMTRPLLPKSAVDEWGFSDESLVNSSGGDSEEKDVSRLYEQSPALSKHRAYIDGVHKYLWRLSNFMTQGYHVIVLNPHLGRAEVGQEQQILRLAKEKGLKTDQGRLSTVNLHDSFVALKELQTEFRNRFSRFIPIAELDRLEEKENRLIRELWPLWFQFVFHPKRKKQNAAQEFAKARDETLKRVRREIRRELGSLGQEGFSAREAKRDLQHEGEEIPCIIIDLNDSTLYWQAIQETITGIQRALHNDSNRSLRYYAIQFWMTRLAIVPLIRGRSLLQSVLILPTYALQSGNALEKWYLYIPHEIPDEDWAKLRVSLWDRKLFEPAIRFSESVARLSVFAAQAGDLNRLSANFEDDDSGVIERFVKYQEENIGEHLQQVFDDLDDLLRRHDNSQISLEERPSLYAALDLLTQMHPNILPSEDYKDEVKMSISTAKDWSERLEQARGQAEHFKLLWIYDVLAQSPTRS